MTIPGILELPSPATDSFMYEPIDRKCTQDLHILPAIVQGEGTSHIVRAPLHIVNPTNSTVTLYANTKIAEAYVMDTEEADMPNLEPQLKSNLGDYTPSFKNFAGTFAQLLMFQNLIMEFLDVFSSGPYDLGKCTVTAPTIQTNSDQPPVKPFRLPPKFGENIRKQVSEMLRLGIISEAITQWVSNIVPVGKKDGSIRLCIDFRPLNFLTIADPFPLPRLQALLEKIAGCFYFTSLDLMKGYWQIPLDEKSSQKCGFICENAVYRFNFMPFGLKNASSIFSRIMAKVLTGILNAVAYIDDVLIYTPEDDIMAHRDNLRQVFERLREFRLKVRGDKCSFASSEIIFLGHKVTREGYQPSPTNVETILNFPIPKNAREIKSFYGCVSFFRNSLERLSELAEPMLRLLKKGNKFSWSEEQQKSFENLKTLFTKPPILRKPNYDAPFHLFTDASQIGQASTLLQIDDITKCYYVVAFFSRLLTDPEKRLPATHNELGAIVRSLRHFRGLLYLAKIIIHTDHKPLIYLFNKASTSAKLSRYLLEIQDHDIHVVHVKGKENLIADGLSRMTPTVTLEEFGKEALSDSLEPPFCFLTMPYANFGEVPSDMIRFKDVRSDLYIMSIRSLQYEDEILSPILQYLETGVLPQVSENLESAFAFHVRNFEVLENGCLYLKNESNGIRQLVIPKKLISYIQNHLLRLHELGRVHFKPELFRQMTWDDMQKDLLKIYGSCTKCLRKIMPTVLRAQELVNDEEGLRILDANLVRTEAAKDGTMSKVSQLTLRGWLTDTEKLPESVQPYYLQRKEIQFKQGMLTFKGRIVIPSSLREDVLQMLHTGHFGKSRMIEHAKNYVWWPRMDAEIENFVKECEPCMENARTTAKVSIQQWPYPSGPFMRVHVDYAGPFLGAYWLIIIDAYSKFPHIFKTSSTTSETTIKYLQVTFAIHGYPICIVSDNGPQLVSQKFEQYCLTHGIKHLTTAPYHPRSNDEAERFVGTFKSHMMKAKSAGARTSDALMAFLLAYRSMPHSTTGKSPSVMLFGRQIRTQIDMLLPRSESNEITQNRERQERNYNKTTRDKNFEVEDLIWYRKEAKTPWKAGCVDEIIGNTMYGVTTDEGKLRLHANQLRPRRPQPAPRNATIRSSSSTLLYGAAVLIALAMPTSQALTYPFDITQPFKKWTKPLSKPIEPTNICEENEGNPIMWVVGTLLVLGYLIILGYMIVKYAYNRTKLANRHPQTPPNPIRDEVPTNIYEDGYVMPNAPILLPTKRTKSMPKLVRRPAIVIKKPTSLRTPNYDADTEEEPMVTISKISF
uniref:RNA-directed DNA polymerase n=1 Tax=Acrobeloides nanus TaxID=290746 RepID=A0A914DN60_9BILA